MLKWTCAVAAIVLTAVGLVLSVVKVKNEKRMTQEYTRQSDALERIADKIDPTNRRKAEPQHLLSHEGRVRRWEELQFETERKARESCEKRGKSVIRSSWDHRMVDCR